MLTIWIQNSDLSIAVEKETDSANDVISAYQEKDWDYQIEQEKTLEEAGLDCCPAGLGIVKSEGVILHLIPQADQKYRGFWHTRDQKKIFGVFPTSIAKVLEFSALSSSTLPEVITNFFSNDDHWLNQNLPLKENPHE